MFTTSPLTVIARCETSWRASARVEPKPMRYTTLSRRDSRMNSRLGFTSDIVELNSGAVAMATCPACAGAMTCAASFRSPASVRFASFEAFAAILTPSPATTPGRPSPAHAHTCRTW